MVSEMTQTECHAILTANTIGRLACVRGGTPYVVPTSYVYEGRHIYSFSLIGLKIRAMRSDPQACFEVDEIKSPRNWWSVLAFGTYEELTESDHWRNEREHAWALLQKARPNWWSPGGEKPARLLAEQAVPPHLFFHINVERVSGRRGSNE